MGLALTLKVARFVLSVAGEGDLGLLPFELLQNLLVCHIALLVILANHESTLVAYTSFSRGRKGIADVVGLADVAVDPAPPVLTIALLPFARLSVLPARKRSTKRRGAIISAPPGRADTPSGSGAAV
jgi:hypothetical protein